MAKISFDWQQATAESADRRAELRRQKWQIRRQELELIASKNFLLPRLDAVGRYRWRGFGDDLIGSDRGVVPGTDVADNAYANLTGGDYQEWQMGVELSVPLGYRRGHAAVRNAELTLARARAILRDQQREVVHELADAVAEMDRAYTVSQTSYNRLIASREQLGAVQAAYEAEKATFDSFLDAQRRLAEAETNYFRSLAVYAVATKNVHFVKGTLLEFDGVFLSEGPWAAKAYHDAAEREKNRSQPRPLNYASSQAPVVGWGEMSQTCADGTLTGPLEIEHPVDLHPPLPESMTRPMSDPSAQAKPLAPRDVKPVNFQPHEDAANGDASALNLVNPAAAELPLRSPQRVAGGDLPTLKADTQADE
jgi:hypothetical protein